MSNRPAQFYAYAVCLLAVIVALISLTSIMEATFERASPLQAEHFGLASLASFESYRATYRRDRGSLADEGSSPDSLSETALRQRYDALVEDRLLSVDYNTTRTLATSGTLLVVALALFGFHWRWVRRGALLGSIPVE